MSKSTLNPQELKQFNEFMQNFLDEEKKNPGFGFSAIKTLKTLAPEEDFMQTLNVIKEDKQLLENYGASDNGVTPETFEDTVIKVQQMLSGETATTNEDVYHFI